MTLPPPELDLTRLAYVARHLAEKHGLSYADLRRCSGCSARQISYLMNGKPINAGATFMLAEVLGIDLAAMFESPATGEHVTRIRRMCAPQGVEEITLPHQTLTLPVSRETEAAE